MRAASVIVPIIAMLTLCTSCIDDSQRFVVMSDVDNEQWEETTSLYYENSDTLSKRRLSVALRYNDNFQSDTLSLSLRVSLPDGRYAKERITFGVDRPYHRAGASTIVTLPYREASVLHLTGCYIFSLTADSPQRGIEAVGIVIEREQKQN